MTTDPIQMALEALRAEVRALRVELAMQRRNAKTPRQARYERRCSEIRELAEATGLGRTYAAAGAVLVIIAGKRPPPPACERIVQRLQADAECPLSVRGIWRVIGGTN